MNFTMTELILSKTARKFNIDNTPKNMFIYTNLMRIVVEILQPLRNRINKPILVTSGYRCNSLNQIVGGVSNSQHLTGNAVDIVVNGRTPKEIISIINNSNLPFDQLIEEESWTHISLKDKNNRKEIL